MIFVSKDSRRWYIKGPCVSTKGVGNSLGGGETREVLIRNKYLVFSGLYSGLNVLSDRFG